MKIYYFILTITLLVILAAGSAETQPKVIEELIQKSEKQQGEKKILTLAEATTKFFQVDPRAGIAFGMGVMRMADSLKLPSAKSSLYNAIGTNYWAIQLYDSARYFYRMGMENSMLYNDSAQMAVSFNRMGLLYETLGKFDSSLYVFGKELEIYRKLKNPERVCNVLSNFGTIHLNRGEFKTAAVYLLEATGIAEKLHENDILLYNYLKLGQVYAETKDYPEAKKWFQKGIDLALAKQDKVRAGIGYDALGIVYNNEGNYETAMALFQKALQIIGNLPAKSVKMAVFQNIGNVYQNLKQFEKAVTYHKQALALGIEMKSPVPIARQKIALGEDYYGMKKYQAARTLYEESLPVLTSNKNQSDLVILYQKLIDVNTVLQDYRQVAEYYRTYTSLRDSLNQNELNTALDSLKVRFKTEQTTRENAILKDETALKNKTISLQWIIIAGTLFFIVLLCVFVYVVVKSRRKIRQTNDLLESMNVEIVAKAEELQLINEKLNDLSSYKDLMTTFLVHDLKNALNIIVNADLRSDPDQKLALIRHSGKRMLKMVNNMLDITGFENSKMELNAKEFSYNEIAEDVYRQVKMQAATSNLTISFNNDLST